MSARTRLLLIASLALNLFLAGLIGTALVLDRGPAARDPAPAPTAERAGPRGPRGMWAAADRLPPEKAEALRQVLRQAAEEGRPRVARLRQARRDAVAAMVREPYDPAAVREALARARTEELAARGGFDEAVTAYAARLEPQERAVIAEALRRRRSDPRSREKPPERRPD